MSHTRGTGSSLQRPLIVSGTIMAKRGRRQNQTGRSEGEARHIRLDYWMLEHPAFLALSPNAKVTLLFMLKRYDGTNNGKIGFGVRSGCFVPKQGTGELLNRPFGVSRSNIGRALTELESAGFIACTQPATFNQKRLTREWRLTWLVCNGRPPTREFASLDQPQKTKPSPTGGTMGQIQSHGRDYENGGRAKIIPYSPTGGTIAQLHSPTGGTHLVTRGVGERATETVGAESA